MKYTFRLSRPKSESKTSIRLDIVHKGRRSSYGTGYSVHPELWNQEKQAADPSKHFFKKHLKQNPHLRIELKKLNKQLLSVSKAALDYESEMSLKGRESNAKGLKSYLEDKLRDGKLKTAFLTEYFEESYLKGIESGRITHKKNGEKKRFAASTIKVKKQTLNALKKYESDARRRIRFDDIDQDWYDTFTNDLMEAGYKQNYIGRLIKEIKVLLRISFEEGLHDNKIYQSRNFTTITEQTKAVYLSQNELNELQALQLEGMDRIYRDMFLIGCYTAMRFSDYSTLSKANITKNGDYLKKITKKTGEEVYIPLHPFVKKTLNEEHYHNRPKVHPQKLNARIKQLAKAAGITQSVEVKENRKGRTVLKTVPKYRLITSHTARRTASTLMYLNDVPTLDIMQITGHKTEKSFLKYIRVTPEQAAKRMRSNRFFSPLKAVK